MRRLALTLLMALLFSTFLFSTQHKYFARLSYVEGEVMIERAAEPGLEDATINMPVGEGDRIIVAQGRAELYLGHMSYIRLNTNSKIDVIELPFERSRARAVVRLVYGEIFIRIGRRSLDFTLQFADGEFIPIREGLYRVIIDGPHKEFYVEEGFAELRIGAESMDLGIHELVRVEGYDIFGPERVYRYRHDDFARWNERRDDRMWRRARSVHYLPPELSDYAWELDYYGTWRYVPPYGWVWVPNPPFYGWRPYYYGYWHWVPGGWFWVGYEPWGWVVYHYGRWGWSASIGWYWIPVPTWGYAWVSWTWWDSYIGWCPLDFYGRPIIIINNVVYHYYDYVPINSYSWVFVHRSQLMARDIRRVALKKYQLSAFAAKKVRVYSTPPALRPVYSLRKTALGYKKVVVSLKPYQGRPVAVRKSLLRRSAPSSSTKSRALSRSSATSRSYKSSSSSSSSRKAFKKGAATYRKPASTGYKSSTSYGKKKVKKKKDQAYYNMDSSESYYGKSTAYRRGSYSSTRTYRRAYSYSSRDYYGYSSSSRRSYSSRSYYRAYSRPSRSYYPDKSYYSRPSKNYSSYSSRKAYSKGSSTYKSYKSYRSYSKPSYSGPSRSWSSYSRSYSRSSSSRSSSRAVKKRD